jgi:hypothetical protein
VTVAAGAVAGPASLERPVRTAPGHDTALSGPAIADEPGIALLTGGRLNPTAATAPLAARAAHLADLAALVAARHDTGSSVGDALPRARWVDASPPRAWLPSADERGGSGRGSPALDRAALATIAAELLGGPDCPPGPASLLRRAARAPGAAPLPQEWVIAIRRALPGAQEPARGLGGPPVLNGTAPQLTMLLLDSGPMPTEPGAWRGREVSSGHLILALAGRHGEHLVLPLQPATAANLPADGLGRVPLEVGPDLVRNVSAHALEASVILAADGVPVDRVEIMVVGSRPGVTHDVAELAESVRQIVLADR